MDETIDINLLLRDPNADISAVMTELRSGRITPMPATGTFKKQLDPKQHDIMDPQLRPDKLVNVDPDSPDYGATRSIMVNQEGSTPEKHRIEKVARIAMPWQQLIVNRAVGITFGNPVKYRATPEDDQQKSLMAAILRVMSDNKEPTVNRRVARELYGMTEVAERWYVTEGEKPHYNYSQKGTKFKLRVVIYSPAKGDSLYPYFNEDRDLVAFSREYTRKDSKGHTITYFETLTSDYFYLWKNDGDSQAQGNHWQ